MKKPTGGMDNVEARRQRIARLLAIGAVRAAAASAKAKDPAAG